MSEFYVAILERNKEGEVFATVPDLPGANSAAATEKEALELIVEFANDYVADLVADGHPVPPARRLGEIEVEEGEEGRVLIPVEVPGKAVKISISIDAALLARADRVAAVDGMSRSAFIADALGAKLRAGREGIVARSSEERGDDVRALVTELAKDHMLVFPVGRRGMSSVEVAGVLDMLSSGKRGVITAEGVVHADLSPRKEWRLSTRKEVGLVQTEGRAPRKR